MAALRSVLCAVLVLIICHMSAPIQGSGQQVMTKDSSGIATSPGLNNVEVTGKNTNAGNVGSRGGGGGGGSGGYSWGWGGGGGGGGGGGWGWGDGGGEGGGRWKSGCGEQPKPPGTSRDTNSRENRKGNPYAIGEYAQCMERNQCRGMRLECPLHCGGPCFYDCTHMCKAHCQQHPTSRN